MTANSHAPEHPDRIEWDVVVVGTGMGGATAGYELARLGRRVLFIEKGLFLQGQSASAGGRQQSGGGLATNLDPTAQFHACLGRLVRRIEVRGQAPLRLPPATCTCGLPLQEQTLLDE